jgi:type I restriction enzyme S subunit
VPDTIVRSIITKHVYRITVEPRLIDPYYLMNALRGCEAVLEQTGANVRGQTRPGINGTILKSIFVPLPTLQEQSEIVVLLNSMMASAAATERETSRALTLLDRLDQANLTEAFRGELCAETRARSQSRKW